MAGVALYASLFDPRIARLQLIDLPASHAEGPEFLNVLRFLDMPQAVAMAAERTSVQLDGRTAGAWQFPTSVAASLGWDSEPTPHGIPAIAIAAGAVESAGTVRCCRDAKSCVSTLSGDECHRIHSRMRRVWRLPWGRCPQTPGIFRFGPMA